MTEASGGGVRGAGGAPGSAGRIRSIARAAGGPRRPVHVVVAVGLTTGVYAAALAGIAALEGASEARLAADRAPAAAAVTRLREAHDALEARLAQLAVLYASAADRYRGIAGGIAAHETALEGLVAEVRSASGSAAALSVPPTRLPAVSATTPSAGGRPTVNACTTASGKPC